MAEDGPEEWVGRGEVHCSKFDQCECSVFKCLNVCLFQNVDIKKIQKFKKSEWNLVMRDSICAFEGKMSCINYQVFLFTSGQRSLGLRRRWGTGKEEPGIFRKLSAVAPYRKPIFIIMIIVYSFWIC